MSFPVHLDTMLRMCGAATIVTNQSSFNVQGLLAAVVNDMDTHPSSSPASVISNMSGLQALGQLTGLDVSALSGLSGLSGITGLTGLTGMSGLGNLMSGLGINISGLSGAMSSLGSLAGSGLSISNLGSISSITSSIGSVTGISIGAGSDLSQLNNIASAIGSGGLSNLGSLSGLAGIAGIGNLGNYLGLAQNILGAGGNMAGIANALSGAAGLSGGPGALISQLQSNFFIEGKQIIATMVDGSVPDIMGMVVHATGLPIPMQGAMNFFVGQGSGAAGVGMLQQLGLGNFGNLNIGELVAVGQQIVGQVSSFTSLGGGSGVMQLSNMQGSPITPGTTVVGQTSGNFFTFANFFDSRIQTGVYAYPSIDTIVDNTLVQDNGEYIVIDDYFYLYPSLNLTASVITV